MQAYIFVDYDNVRPIRAELTDLETEQNLIAIANSAVAIAKSRHERVDELVIRLYDGWTDRVGTLTERAVRVIRVIAIAPRRLFGYRISYSVVTAPILLDETLIGLWRDGAQKMVDTLITCDVTWCALSIDCPLIVMSNDDDMIPGAATAGRIVDSAWERKPVCLMRLREKGEGLNDSVLSAAGVHFEIGVL